MFLVFEGLDKTGKGTLEKIVDKMTNFEHIIVDRGPIGYIVYDKIHGRETPDRLKNFEKEWDMIKDDSIIIYLYAKGEKIIERQKMHNEEVFTPDRVSREVKTYIKVLSDYTRFRRCILVDTTYRTPLECANSIMMHLNRKEMW